MNGKVFGIPVVLIVLILVLLTPVLFVEGIIVHKLDQLQNAPVKTVILTQPGTASVSATLTPEAAKFHPVVSTRSGVLK